MNFVKLTLGGGDPVWINLDRVSKMEVDASKMTRIYQDPDADIRGYHHFAAVKEMPDEIFAKASEGEVGFQGVRRCGGEQIDATTDKCVAEQMAKSRGQGTPGQVTEAVKS